MKKDFAKSCIKEIGNWMAMQIDHEDFVTSDAAHFAKDLSYLFIHKMMGEE